MVNIYLYGLQRSGTNTLEEFLKLNYNIQLSNTNCTDRSSYKHKHLRIYNNKKYIPVDQYYNNYIINNLNDLDNLLQTDNNKYIVIIKDIFSWCVSINKWAIKCNWKYKNKMDYVNDYINYINKWNEIKNERVLIIYYEEYLDLLFNNNTDILIKINNFLKLNKTMINIQFPEKVNFSDKFDNNYKNYYKNKLYMNEYTEEEKEYIFKIIQT